MIGPILTSASPYYPRARRLANAATAALNRVDPTTGEGIFAPLGELLVWLVAIDDLLDKADHTYLTLRDQDPDGVVLPGIRYARNASVHGLLVTATTYSTGGGMFGGAPFGAARFGEGPSTRWSARTLIGHTPPHPSSAQERSYDQHLAGSGVLEPLRVALGFLVNAVS